MFGRRISVQRAYWVMSEIAREFGVPAVAVPPIYVSEAMPRRFAGMFLHENSHIRIRPRFLTEGTIAHEVGHFLFHYYRPGECEGFNPECEEVAKLVERWWLRGRPKGFKHAKPRRREYALIFKLTQPITKQQFYRLADHIRQNFQVYPALQDLVGMGLSKDGSTLTFKLSNQLNRQLSQKGWDGIIPIAWIIAGLLGLLGIGFVVWKIEEILAKIKEWGPYIIAGIVGLCVLAFAVWLIIKALAPPKPKR